MNDLEESNLTLISIIQDDEKVNEERLQAFQKQEEQLRKKVKQTQESLQHLENKKQDYLNKIKHQSEFKIQQGEEKTVVFAQLSQTSQYQKLLKLIKSLYLKMSNGADLENPEDDQEGPKMQGSHYLKKIEQQLEYFMESYDSLVIIAQKSSKVQREINEKFKSLDIQKKHKQLEISKTREQEQRSR